MAADNYVEIFKVTDKDDQHFEIQAKDPEAVAMSEGELTDTVVSFEGAAGDSIGSFTDFIDNFVNGTKIGRWFKNFYAGCQYILHVGSLVNNCVTDNADLPLSAAQGKVLMDELTQVKSDLTELDDIAMRQRDYIDGTIDLNDLKQSGIYYYNSSSIPTNAYSEGASSILVFNANATNNVVLQVSVRFNQNDFEPALRVYHGANDNWRPWKEITLS